MFAWWCRSDKKIRFQQSLLSLVSKVEGKEREGEDMYTVHCMCVCGQEVNEKG